MWRFTFEVIYCVHNYVYSIYFIFYVVLRTQQFYGNVSYASYRTVIVTVCPSLLSPRHSMYVKK